MTMLPRLPSPLRALAAASMVALPAHLPADALLDLGDGNFLRGEPAAIKEGILTWKHTNSGTEFRYPLDSVWRLLFSGEGQPNPTGDILLLDNGDVLSGQLESLDKESAILKSPAIGTVKLPRQRLRTARLASGTGAIGAYTDDGDLSGWISSAPGGKPIHWSAVNRTLSFNGRGQESIGKDVKMPPSADVSFDMAWSPTKTARFGLGPEFTMVLCADKAKPEQSPMGYTLNFNRNWLTVMHLNNDPAVRQQSTLGRIQLNQFLEGKTSMRVRIIVNRATRRLHVLINGNDAGELQDEAVAPPDGTAIQLTGNGDTGLRLRNLRVEPWNGLIGTKLSTTSKSARDRDLLLAADGDEIFGEIIAIHADAQKDRVVEMVIPMNQSKAMNIPVKQIRHLSFAHKDVPNAENAGKEGATTIRLDNGSRLTGIIDNFDGKVLHFLFLGKEPVALPAGKILAIDFPAATAEAAKPSPKKPNPGEFFEE